MANANVDIMLIDEEKLLGSDGELSSISSISSIVDKMSTSVSISSVESKPKEKKKRSKTKKSTNSNPAVTAKTTNSKPKQKSADDRHAELMDLLSNIKAQNSDTKNEISSFKRTIDNKFKTVDGEIKSQGQRVCSMERKIADMESQMNVVKYERELSKQQQLKNNISIHGLPISENENAIKTALLVFAAFGLNFSEQNITAAYRASGAASATRSIIVKFAEFKDKLSVLNAKTKKPVTMKDVVQCSGELQNRSIYLNNHVTPFFAKLLAAGRNGVKSEQLHSCWIGTDGCLIKVKEGDSPKIVKSLTELEAITGSSGTSAARKRAKPDESSPQLEQNKRRTNNGN